MEVRISLDPADRALRNANDGRHARQCRTICRVVPAASKKKIGGDVLQGIRREAPLRGAVACVRRAYGAIFRRTSRVTANTCEDSQRRDRPTRAQAAGRGGARKSLQRHSLVFCLTAFLFAPPTWAHEGVPTREFVEQLVSRSLKSWENEDRDEFAATSHPDLLFAFPRRRVGLAGAMEVFDFWTTNYEDTRVYIHWILVDGDRFAMEYQFATTNIHTGKRTNMGTVAIGRVREGRIILLKEYTDGRVAVLQEQGELPLEEGEEPFPWPRVPDAD